MIQTFLRKERGKKREILGGAVLVKRRILIMTKSVKARALAANASKNLPWNIFLNKPKSYKNKLAYNQHVPRASIRHIKTSNHTLLINTAYPDLLAKILEKIFPYDCFLVSRTELGARGAEAGRMPRGRSRRPERTDWDMDHQKPPGPCHPEFLNRST